MAEPVVKKPRGRAVLAVIGHTAPAPLGFELEGATIRAEGEFLNPSGSVKDRLASSVQLVGTSSGANAVAALQLATELGPRANVVTLLGDRAERYFSPPLFDPARREPAPS